MGDCSFQSASRVTGGSIAIYSCQVTSQRTDFPRDKKNEEFCIRPQPRKKILRIIFIPELTVYIHFAAREENSTAANDIVIRISSEFTIICEFL